MEDFEEHAARLQQEFDAERPQDITSLRCRIDRLKKTLAENGVPMPVGLKRIDRSLRLEEEDDFFDNMPV